MPGGDDVGVGTGGYSATALDVLSTDDGGGGGGEHTNSCLVSCSRHAVYLQLKLPIPMLLCTGITVIHRYCA